MSTMNVTDSSFDEDILKSSTPVVVDFWAEWCGPCKQIAPALDEIATEMADKVKVAKVNVDENPNSPSKYGVRGIPMLLLVKDGEVISQRTGALPKGQLVEWINESL